MARFDFLKEMGVTKEDSEREELDPLKVASQAYNEGMNKRADELALKEEIEQEGEDFSIGKESIDDVMAAKNQIDRIEDINEERAKAPSEYDKNKAAEEARKSEDMEAKKRFLDMVRRPQKEKEESDKKTRAEQLVDAQDIDRRNRMLKGFLQSGITLGHAIAGSDPTKYLESADKLDFGSETKRLKEQFQQEDADKSAAEKEYYADPNSIASVMLRNAYEKVTGRKLSKETSAAVLQKGGVNLSFLTSQEQKKILEDLKQKQKEQDKKDKALAKLEDDQKDFAERVTFKIQKDYDQYNDSIKNADQVAEMIQQIKAEDLHEGSADVGLLYKFIKAYDPTSVVREGEIKLAQGALSLFDRIRKSKDNIITGAMLTPTFRESVKKLAEGAARLEQKRFARKKAQFINLAGNRGISPQDYNRAVFPGVDISDTFEKKEEVPAEKQKVEAKPTKDSKQFPMQVRKDGKVATVKNEKELEEARSEGWQ